MVEHKELSILVTLKYAIIDELTDVLILEKKKLI